MKYTSALMTAASGSLKGITASHNRGGAYFRGRTVPTNPSTTRQTAVRNAMRTSVNAWIALSSTNRTNWATYANNTPVTNPLGAPVTLTGQQMYIRQSVVRIQASTPVVATAPTVFDLGSFTPPTLTLTASSTTLSVAFNASDAWATEGTNSFMAVYTSGPQNPSINFFKGPFQFVGKISGTSSPATLTLPIAAGVTGTKTFYSIVVSRSDGRLTGTFLGASTV